MRTIGLWAYGLCPVYLTFKRWYCLNGTASPGNRTSAYIMLNVLYNAQPNITISITLVHVSNEWLVHLVIITILCNHFCFELLTHIHVLRRYITGLIQRIWQRPLNAVVLKPLKQYTIRPLIKYKPFIYTRGLQDYIYMHKTYWK